MEAAVYRWHARRPGAVVDEKAVNLDGRPAVAVSFQAEGSEYIRDQLLLDPVTYSLIGQRTVATDDYSDEQTGRRLKKGDVIQLHIRVRAGIVDKAGQTPG